MAASMVFAAQCTGVVAAASPPRSGGRSLVEKLPTKLQLQRSGLQGAASIKKSFSSDLVTLKPLHPFRLHCATASLQRELQVATTAVSKVVVIDNYDSFTYNLCQYLGDLGCDYEVVRNDEITIEELRDRKPRGILVSPGPGAPKDSGISLASIVELGPKVPIFGVCMGLQCMGEAFGGKIVRAPNGVVHGKTSPVFYDEKGEDGLMAGLPNPFVACRYHSLVIEKESFPHEELEITAWTEDGLIMGIRHKKYRHIQGVQFHPESIITENGKRIVANFVKMLDQAAADSHAGREAQAMA